MSDALSQNAVEIRGLSKTYAADAGQPPKVALKDINLDIPAGSFFGLLGPNGAGKSTLINTLAGLVLKTSGSAKICGYDIETEMRQARTAIGVVPQELNIDPFFTPRELLDLQAGLYGVPKKDRLTNEILDAVGLQDKCDAYPRTLSGGMRRRLLVAKAMVHRPRVLVLDEPSAGVDIDLRRQLWVHVKELNAQGTTVLLTTHYLEEAEALCDRIAIINHGELIACESTSTLLQRLDAKQMMITVDQDVPTLPEALSSFNIEQKSSRQLIFRYSPSKTNSGEILTAIQNAGLGILDLATKEVELEDIFLHLTSGEETEER
jgi:ABC-2 type transport system ATP-binding protein